MDGDVRRGWDVQQSPGHDPRSRRFALPRWRLFTWGIIAFHAAMLVWLLLGVRAAGAEGDEACASAACSAAHGIGTVLGVGALAFLWTAGAVVLGVLWVLTHPRARKPRRPRKRRTADTGNPGDAGL